MSTAGPDQPSPTPAFDADSLRARYRAERDKRLRPEGNAQYVEVAGRFAHYLDDPYVEPGFQRAPLFDEVQVAVIGGGFGGLLAGARLREAGVDGIRMIDPAGDFGGTWYWNRYPGIACDIEAYSYLPLLEETGYMPKQKYADGREILEHSQAIARCYDLYRDALFQTRVEKLTWDEAASRWILETNHGDRMRARHVVLATGPLNRPKLPGIPGLDSFAGHSFHASRWDYRYTGGNSEGGLTGLAGKRVGVIGTGATAVQIVPHIGQWAGHLHVFQRTPSSVDTKVNPPTDPAWAASLKPGWHQQRMDNFNNLVSGVPQAEDLVHDGWTDIITNLLLAMQKTDSPDLTPEGIQRAVELADFEKMESIRARIDAVVKDRKTAAALKPWYRQFCKRPCFHNEYLETFNRDNVTLVDTEGRGVERITPKGVVAGGREYELDCLVFATGFEVGTDYCRRAGMQITGRGGTTLTEWWSGGVKTLHGMHVEGFPNCYLMSNSQAGFTASYPHMLAEQARHLTYVIRRAVSEGLSEVEATREGVREWVDRCIEKAGAAAAFLEDCTPGYYNNEGKLSERSVQDGFYGGGTGSPEFIAILDAWRSEGSMRGLAQRR